ncbi:MAG: HAMP domain-containing protein [Methylobacillus sp.]|jgi:PAS domain S-box-containing protein|nr:HAMP domain-containing protein [Methylobacillus sp.]
MKYVVFVSVVFGAILLYMLSHASANTAVSGQNYTILLALNLALAIFFIFLLAQQLWKLYRQIRAQVIGSRLAVRLLGMFALMALIPGVIVYAVSVNFLTRSIESWFNVKVEAALNGGLRLGQNALDILLADLEEKGEHMALSLAFQPSASHLSMLNDLRERNGVRDAALLTTQGRIVAYSSGDASSFLPEVPTISQLNEARQRMHGRIEPIPGKGLYLRVLVPVNSTEIHEDTRILQLLQPVPTELSKTAEEVQSVYQNYQELSVTRTALKEVFALTLTLVLMLAMLSALAFAFVLSRRLSAPLGVLAEGTRAIASGDFGKVLPVRSKDELGVLVQSFNSMTRQLSDARQAAERNRARVEAARGHLATILSHLSSGVIAFDGNFRVRTFNPSASQILGADLETMVEQPLERLAHSPALAALIQTILMRFADDGEWQQQIEFEGVRGEQVLLVRGTRLPTGSEGGYVVVFDDVTMLLQAQRDAAWGEVARRLAHEIKNPLTPIMLSAERLEHKLSDKLEGGDAEVLKRATQTIVGQVSALKNMVDEFSEYARSPALNLAALDFNTLVRDVLALYEAHGSRIKLEAKENLPLVYGDATMLRQVLHNLLKNAQEVLESKPDSLIRVKIASEGDMVRLEISDNGPGFPPELMTRAFEPYMTTKRHGTGLGLAIVKKIVEEHKGTIRIENQPQGGAIVAIFLPVKEAA